MNRLNQKNGITLIALVITVIVILILAGITISIGNKLIEEARIESFATSMITIKSKSKVYAEEVNSQVWNLKNDISAKEAKKEEIYLNTYNMPKTTLTPEQIQAIDSEVSDSNNIESYSITMQTLEKMGLKSIEDPLNYIVVYNKDDYTKLDIINKNGIKYKGENYYSLSQLQQAMLENS